MTTAIKVKCDCGSCACTVDPETAIAKDGKNYCSEACANGHPNGQSCPSTGWLKALKIK
jgi:metallothionein